MAAPWLPSAQTLTRTVGIVPHYFSLSCCIRSCPHSPARGFEGMASVSSSAYLAGRLPTRHNVAGCEPPPAAATARSGHALVPDARVSVAPSDLALDVS
jgi:hypothetical protein